MSAEEVRRSIAETAPSLFECSPAPQGGVRVRTPLVYSDGGVVDVFVLEHDREVSVTDLGEALGWVRMQSVDTGRTGEQTRRIEDTCQTLGVTLERGQLVLRLGSDAVTAEAVLRIGQAAVRVADHGPTTRQ